jgi:hypothetical protein
LRQRFARIRGRARRGTARRSPERIAKNKEAVTRVELSECRRRVGDDDTEAQSSGNEQALAE